MSFTTLQLMVSGRIPVKIGGVSEVEILELLGTGSFGSVWKVADCATKKLYVLKAILGLKPDSILGKRVRLEAEVSIPSEYIVPVIGLREWDASTFLILFEYYPAQSLDKLLETGTLTGTQKQTIFQQTLLGVSDAHRCNIVHRDLKPSNILVGSDGNVKIIDFGVSKFKGKNLTISGEIIGTIPYMAPELLVDGANVADGRADIYSLGHILYELAMGEHFWTRQGWCRLEDCAAYFNQTPRPTEAIHLSDFYCDFSPHAHGVLRRMIKINPEERYASVDEIISDLGYITHSPAIPDTWQLRYPLLIVESGTNKEARTFVNIEDGGAMVFGRADIAGADESISRRHIEFTRSGNRYFLRDAGSKNGTLLRGKLLDDKPLEIYDGDRIKAGDVFLRFAFLREG
jgi:serine/threonine-protein kinase